MANGAQNDLKGRGAPKEMRESDDDFLWDYLNDDESEISVEASDYKAKPS